MVQGRTSRTLLLIGGLVVSLILAPAVSTALSQPPANGHWYDVRSVPAAELGLLNPVGLSYSPAEDLFFALENANGGGAAELTAFTPFEEPAGTTLLASPAAQPLNTAFYGPTGELVALDRQRQQLAQIEIGPRGDRLRSSQDIRQFRTTLLRIANPQGMAVDDEGGRLFILDGNGPRIIRIQADAQHSFDGEAATRDGRVQRTTLHSLRNVALRGIAFNPSNGHLYVASPAEQKIYELTEQGDILSVLDIAELDLRDLQGMVFAPSADLTDDPAIYNLYLADSGLSSDNPNNGHVVELSLQQLAVQEMAAMVQATLVNIIDTSKHRPVNPWNPSSPDPSGIAYRPGKGLLISDGEVEENHPDYKGFNIFESTTDGNLLSWCSTKGFSNEPIGAAVNPGNGRLYFSDDFHDSVFEINLVDGVYCNGNDVVTTLDIQTLYPEVNDPEGLAYGQNKLFVSDGVNKEVYLINLGGNGVVGGGDDTAAGHFDVAIFGLNDPEGIEYNPDAGTLFIVSTTRNDSKMQEVTLSGALVNTYDLSAFLGTAKKRSGVAYGPGSSLNSGAKSVYIASRGVDNDTDPNENDGKVYEVKLGSSGPNPTPTNTPPPGNTPTPTPTAPPPSSQSIYLSLDLNGSVGGVASQDEDILHFNGTAWSVLFDGSDVGLGSTDVEDFHRLDVDTILMVLSNAVTLNSVSVDQFDIVRFDATSPLGPTTAGTFSLYFDGPDVGLGETDVSGEKIDAFSMLPDGRLLISTKGNPGVGVMGARDEDLLAFTPTALGANTSGTWTMYFDGSDVGLGETSGEDVDGVTVANGVIYLTTLDAFAVSGVSGADEDVFRCTATMVGDNTSCTYAAALAFDGSAWGLAGNDVDGIDLP
jgi:hypothetical protein